MLWNVPLDDERTLSIEQFCLAEDMSRQQYDLMRSKGCGPIEVAVPGAGGSIRITPDERRKWHEKICGWEWIAGEDDPNTGDEHVVQRSVDPSSPHVLIKHDDTGYRI